MCLFSYYYGAFHDEYFLVPCSHVSTLGRERWSTTYMHLVHVFVYFVCKTFLELWTFENVGILSLSARYLEKYLSSGLETESADRE